MHLVSLGANKDSFKKVSFNPFGVSLIVGRQHEKAEKKKSLTYNGVGKSLLIYLINFCLGSKENEDLKIKLSGWQFYLEFELDGEPFTVQRETLNQSKVILNGTEISLDKFRNWLGERAFYLSEEVPFLKFRALISQFLRAKKETYFDALQLAGREKPYQTLIRSSYLLGLDILLVQNKHDKKMELDRINSIKKNLEKDASFRDSFSDSETLTIEISSLKDEIESLNSKLDSFQIAENYSLQEEKAARQRAELKIARNQQFLFKEQINNIDQSLSIRHELNPDDIYKMYEEVKLVFPDKVKKTFGDVANFHNTLVTQRNARLTNEKIRLAKSLENLLGEIGATEKQLSATIKFLKDHGALSEYESILKSLAEKKARFESLTRLSALKDEYKNKAYEIKKELEAENQKASAYLTTIVDHIENVSRQFRTYTKRIYPDKSSGIAVTNNDGDNQIRFNIEAKIISDSSDGINECKIFCYDLALAKLKLNHKVGFVCHDSRLYADIDPRQRAELFKIANEEAIKNKIQYIATINEDQIDGMKGWFEDDEFQSIFQLKKVLELTDESSAHKLLGFDVDLDYED